MLTYLQQVIIEECAQHGGPTERCQRIYRNLEGRRHRNRYWRAVQEGTNRYWARQRRITAEACTGLTCDCMDDEGPEA